MNSPFKCLNVLLGLPAPTTLNLLLSHATPTAIPISTAYLRLSSQISLFFRNLKFYLHNPHLSLTVLVVSGLNNLHHCPASGNAPNINQWNILCVLDKIGEKCSPNINHYIFSTDLTRQTKMFSLSWIYKCVQKLLHIGHFYFQSFLFFMAWEDLQSIMIVHRW